MRSGLRGLIGSGWALVPAAIRCVAAMGRFDDQLAVGQLRRQRLLHSVAVYRVCDWTDAFVEVEVVTAPGLQASQGFRFTREAVLAMEVVSDSSPSQEGGPHG